MSGVKNDPRPAAESTPPRVGIVGGGLAGMAAAVAALEQGRQVTLFEQAERLGGRAGSFLDPRWGRLVDYCPHVAMGCCTTLADFCRRTGVAGHFRRSSPYHFFGPDGRQYDLAATRWLPAPLHLLPGLLRLGYLSRRDRWGIVCAMPRLVALGKRPAAVDQPIGPWLREQGQSAEAIERFWSVVLVSALGETVERASLAAAAKVFRDGFFASREAYELRLPDRPLGEIWGDTGEWLSHRGVAVRSGQRVVRIEGDSRRATGVVLKDGRFEAFDALVVAVPWSHVGRLLPAAMLAAVPMLEKAASLRRVPITSAHLWFDRPIMPVEHAAFVGRLTQWVFLKDRAQNRLDCSPRETAADPESLQLLKVDAASRRVLLEENEGQCRSGNTRRDAASTMSESFAPESTSSLRSQTDPATRIAHLYQVVISASQGLLGRPRNEVLGEIRGDLEALWPAARDARLLDARLITHGGAVFSVETGADRLRPTQQTPIANLALAGDWTATGWPATMEGAVRSGYAAAGCLKLSRA